MIPAFAAVAWDVDGTMVDSEPLHQKILIEVCADHGVNLSEVVAIEDSATGVRSAAAAGMGVIGFEHQTPLDADWSITQLSEAISIVLPTSARGARGQESTINGL